MGAPIKSEVATRPVAEQAEVNAPTGRKKVPRIDYNRLLASVPIDEVAKRLGMELRVETSTKAKA